MGWGRTLLLGPLGMGMDMRDTESDVKDIQVELRLQRRHDLSHDETLEALERENEDLKLLFATLIRLLTRKGVLSEDDLRTFAKSVEA